MCIYDDVCRLCMHVYVCNRKVTCDIIAVCNPFKINDVCRKAIHIIINMVVCIQSEYYWWENIKTCSYTQVSRDTYRPIT